MPADLLTNIPDGADIFLDANFYLQFFGHLAGM